MNNEPFEYEPMADETESRALVETVVNVDQTPQLIAPDQLPDLDEMEEGFSLQAKYVEFETPGTEMRGVFVGFTSMRSQQGGSVPVANFQNKDGVWVNAGANLVSQLQHVPQGTPLKVTYRGKEDTKRGNKVKVFEVRILNPKPQPERAPIPQMTLPPQPPIPSKQNGNGAMSKEKFFTYAKEQNAVSLAQEIANRHAKNPDWDKSFAELNDLLVARNAQQD